MQGNVLFLLVTYKFTFTIFVITGHDEGFSNGKRNIS